MKMYYRSGELARLCGVSPDTLRHYERCGLIAQPRRSINGYREYVPETLDRVRAIQAALRIGFTLKELARIFRVRDRGGVPCREVQSLARRKLEETAIRITELRKLQSRLKALIEQWDHALEKTADGQQAGLLHSLAASALGSVHPASTRTRRKFK